MIHQFTYRLFKLKLIQPSDNTITHWLDTHAVKKLEYALRHGNYNTRQLAAEGLEKIGKPSSIPVLRFLDFTF